MSAPHTSARPRPGGGFNPGGDQFGEAMDESAMSQAVMQKQLGQQQAAGVGSPQGVPTGSTALSQPTEQKPRAVGTLTEELVTRPLEDIGKGVLSIFDFASSLGLSSSDEKTPEEMARRQQTFANFQKLTQEEKALANRRYQEDLQKKKRQREEEEQREQLKRQQAAQQISVPSSPKKGAVGPSGSQKQRTVTKLEQDRKTLGGPASAN